MFVNNYKTWLISWYIFQTTLIYWLTKNNYCSKPDWMKHFKWRFLSSCELSRPVFNGALCLSASATLRYHQRTLHCWWRLQVFVFACQLLQRRDFHRRWLWRHHALLLQHTNVLIRISLYQIYHYCLQSWIIKLIVSSLTEPLNTVSYFLISVNAINNSL